MKRITIVSVAATFLASVAAARAATPYHDPAVGVSITPPPGWYDVPAVALGRLAASATNNATQPPDYVVGFTSAASGAMRFPYILVQRQQTGPFDFEAVAGSLDAAGPAAKRALRPDLANRISMNNQGRTTIDRARHTYVHHFQIVGATGTIQGTTYGFAGKDEMIDVHCYDTPAHYAQSDAAFQAVADSVTFDPGNTYVPPAGGGGNAFAGINWQSGAVIGGVGGLVLWGVARVVRRAS